MPPRKKRRTNSSSLSAASSSPMPTTPELSSWPGWCEIESEPAFFNTILHDMGVCGLRVEEVFGVDDSALAILPKPVHAVIFLFRYQQDGAAEQTQEADCPSHVWFANQIPQYACGTVALLNIVNNVPHLDLGQPLQSFKHFTKTFDPIARGHAIDSFDFVRKIHNSFAKSTDMLAIDSLMKEKNMKNAKRLQTQAASAAKTAKAEAKKAAEAAAEQSTTSTVRSNPRRRARNTKSVAEQDNQDEQEQESGFHFIAYMPIEDSVWKLDGLDSFPTNIGRMTPGQDWLSLIQTTLSVRMAEYEEGQIQFSLMAVVQDPIIQARRALAQNLRSIQAIEARLDELTPDWPSFVAADSEDSVVCCPQEVSSLTDAMIAEAPLTPKTAQHLTCTCSETLIRVRTELKKDQTGCLAEIRDSQQTDMLEELESMHRRHDYGSFVKAWMHALVSNGALKSLLDDEQS